MNPFMKGFIEGIAMYMLCSSMFEDTLIAIFAAITGLIMLTVFNTIFAIHNAVNEIKKEEDRRRK